MTKGHEEVEELLNSGRITLTDASTLLEASRDRRDVLRVLTHPLEAAGTAVVLWIGAVAAISAIALGALGVQYDGALDLHLTPAHPPMSLRLIELVIAIPLPALVLWLGLRSKGSHARLIDFLAAISAARVPYVLGGAVLALIGLPGNMSLAAHPIQVLAFVVLSLLSLAWFVTLLYTGAKTASGMSGGKFVGLFVLLLCLSEALSKLTLAAFV